MRIPWGMWEANMLSVKIFLVLCVAFHAFAALGGVTSIRDGNAGRWAIAGVIVNSVVAVWAAWCMWRVWGFE